MSCGNETDSQVDCEMFDTEPVDTQPAEGSEMLATQVVKDSQMLDTEPAESSEMPDTQPDDNLEMLDNKPEESSELMDTEPVESSELMDTEPVESSEKVSEETQPEEDSEITDTQPVEDIEVQGNKPVESPKRVDSQATQDTQYDSPEDSAELNDTIPVTPKFLTEEPENAVSDSSPAIAGKTVEENLGSKTSSDSLAGVMSASKADVSCLSEDCDVTPDMNNSQTVFRNEKATGEAYSNTENIQAGGNAAVKSTNSNDELADSSITTEFPSSGTESTSSINLNPFNKTVVQSSSSDDLKLGEETSDAGCVFSSPSNEDQAVRSNLSPDIFQGIEEKNDDAPVTEENVSVPVSPKEQPGISSRGVDSPDLRIDKPSTSATPAASATLSDDEVLSPSEVSFKIPQQLKHADKRRRSDNSDSSSEQQLACPKRPCLNGDKNAADSRKSITIVKEIRKSPPIDSQEIELHYSASQPDSAHATSSDSIVPLDEDDEIMEVSAEHKESVVEEITLDASDGAPSPSVLLKRKADKQPIPIQIDAQKPSSSPETIPIGSQNSASPVIVGTVSGEIVGPQNTIEFTKRVLVTTTFAVECQVTANAATGKVIGFSIPQVEPPETSIKEDRPTRLSSMSSSGVLGDESSPPSPPRPGRGSISSVVSGPGPFRLQPTSALQRMSMFSTTSSTGSADNDKPNKGLPECVVLNRRKKPNANLETLLNQWSVGSTLQESVASNLSSYIQTAVSTSLNSEEKAPEPSVSTTSEVSDSANGVDEAKQAAILSPVAEEGTLGESQKKKKKAASPSTPSGRTPSRRLRQRKTSSTEQESSEQDPKKATQTPKSERRRRGRPTASPAVGTPRGAANVADLSDSALKPHTPATPCLSLEIQSPSTASTPIYSVPLQEDLKVFAMWTDRKFYPAELKHEVRAGHWQVLFHDKKQKVLPAHSILVINTFECDQPVLALTPDDFYKSGTIVVVNSFEDKDDEYVVKLTGEDNLIKVSWWDLSLSEQQAQSYRDYQRSSASGRGVLKRSIDLDNVVHGKRLRSSKCDSPCSSKDLKVCTSTSWSHESVDEPDSSLNVEGIDPERANLDPLSGKGPRRVKGRKQKPAEKPRNDEDEKILEALGPIPPAGSKIFAGLTFFITSTSVRLQHQHKKKSNSGASEGEATVDESEGYTDCECYVFTRLAEPMAKARLKEQLIAGGGRVLSNVDELVVDELNEDDLQNVFVVSDRPCKTALYIRCLAMGIRSILHDCVIYSCKENKPLKSMLVVLPAGYSDTKKRFVEWTELENRKPFYGKSIIVQSQDRSFVAYWEKVLKSAGAIVKLKNDSDLKFVTVIVAGQPLPELLKMRAEATQVPIVSTYWVVQSLINNYALPPDTLEGFSVDCSESE